jgi:hypothetical protein
MSLTSIETINPEGHIYAWEWNESILSPEQLEYKHTYIDGHPEMRKLLEEKWAEMPIFVDLISAAFHTDKERVDIISNSEYAYLAKNQQLIREHTHNVLELPGKASLDQQDYHLYQVMIAQALDMCFRSGSIRRLESEQSAMNLRNKITTININAEKMLFESLRQQIDEITIHEQAHLGEFFKIVHEASMNGTQIVSTAKIGVNFNLMVIQPEDEEAYKPIIKPSIGGFVHIANEPITTENQRNVNMEEKNDILMAPPSPSETDYIVKDRINRF